MGCDGCKYKYCEYYEYPCIECIHNDGEKEMFEPKENVEHPAHYTGNIECIDAMLETQGEQAVKDFCICNAFKYIWRHEKKNGVEDIKKAAFYINYYLSLTEGGT